MSRIGAINNEVCYTLGGFEWFKYSLEVNGSAITTYKAIHEAIAGGKDIYEYDKTLEEWNRLNRETGKFDPVLEKKEKGVNGMKFEKTFRGLGCMGKEEISVIFHKFDALKQAVFEYYKMRHTDYIEQALGGLTGGKIFHADGALLKGSAGFGCPTVIHINNTVSFLYNLEKLQTDMCFLPDSYTEKVHTAISRLESLNYYIERLGEGEEILPVKNLVAEEVEELRQAVVKQFDSLSEFLTDQQLEDNWLESYLDVVEDVWFLNAEEDDELLWYIKPDKTMLKAYKVGELADF